MVKRILLLGVAALAVGTGARFITATKPARALPTPVAGQRGAAEEDIAVPPDAPASGRHPHWTARWTRATPDVRDLSLAGDGATVAWVDSHGSVRRIAAATGATLWQSSPMPGVNGVTAAPGGDVLAFARLNPLNSVVHLFDVVSAVSSAAPRVTAFPVEGAVWSVAASPRGDRAIVGTGHSLLFLLPLTSAATPDKLAMGGQTTAASPPAPVVAPINAKPTSVGIQGIAVSTDTSSQNAAAILAGTWQDSGICAWDSHGVPLWRHDDPRPDRAYDVHLSADGSTAVAISSRRPRGRDARIHVWDGKTGRLIWSQTLDADNAHALVSANGDVIAVSYVVAPDEGNALGARPAAAGNPAHKIVLFDRSGHRLFADMGGLYFSPELVALSADGRNVTVQTNNNGYLWTLDNHGRILSRVRLPLDPKTGQPPLIRQTLVTADGMYLLVQTGDGQITFYKAQSS